MENKPPKKYWLTYLYTGDYDLIMWTVVILIRILWGQKLQWLNGFWCEFKENSWPMRSWYKNWSGTCFGHGGIGRPGMLGEPGVIDTSTEYHEHFHGRQYEATMLRSFVIGLGIFAIMAALGNPVAGFWTGYVIRMLGPALHVLCNSIQSWLEGKEFYRNAVHEEAAYSITAEHFRWHQKKTTR